MKQVENTILRSCICAVVILLLVGALAFIWLYQSIVQPLEKLKRAAMNIKDGNLDFNVIRTQRMRLGKYVQPLRECVLS